MAEDRKRCLLSNLTRKGGFGSLVHALEVGSALCVTVVADVIHGWGPHSPSFFYIRLVAPGEDPCICLPRAEHNHYVQPLPLAIALLNLDDAVLGCCVLQPGNGRFKAHPRFPGTRPISCGHGPECGCNLNTISDCTCRPFSRLRAAFTQGTSIRK